MAWSAGPPPAGPWSAKMEMSPPSSDEAQPRGRCSPPPHAGSGCAAPLVFAHRGSSGALPEHTLGAYLRAIDEGADGLECDIRLTNDGHLVCLHDRRLGRVSNGRGPVSEHTLAELDALDFGHWHPALPDSADELILDRSEPAVAPAPRARALSR